MLLLDYRYDSISHSELRIINKLYFMTFFSLFFLRKLQTYIKKLCLIKFDKIELRKQTHKFMLFNVY